MKEEVKELSNLVLNGWHIQGDIQIDFKGKGTAQKNEFTINGNWESYRKCKGEIYENNQLIYQGDIFDYQMHGTGRTYNKNGETVYIGEFFQNQKHGYGIINQENKWFSVKFHYNMIEEQNLENVKVEKEEPIVEKSINTKEQSQDTSILQPKTLEIQKPFYLIHIFTLTCNNQQNKSADYEQQFTSSFVNLSLFNQDLVICNQKDQQIQILNPLQQITRISINQPQIQGCQIYKKCFSTAGLNEITFWSDISNQIKKKYIIKQDKICKLNYSRWNYKFLVGDQNGWLSIYDLQMKQKLQSFKCFEDQKEIFDISQISENIYAISNENVKIYDIRYRNCIQNIQNNQNILTMASKKHELYLGDVSGSIQIWNCKSFTKVNQKLNFNFPILKISALNNQQIAFPIKNNIIVISGQELKENETQTKLKNIQDIVFDYKIQQLYAIDNNNEIQAYQMRYKQEQ